MISREDTVLKGILEGKRNKQIAADMNIKEGSVKFHCTNLFKRFGVRSRTQLVLKMTTAVGAPNGTQEGQ